MSTVGDCEIVDVALNTSGGSFLARAGLIASSAVRTVTAACADDTLTRFRLRHPEDLVVRARREVVHGLPDRRGGDGLDDRIGHDRPGGGHEVRRPRELQGRLVGDVVAHFLALRRLGDHVGEAVGVEHPRAEPPADRAERDEEHAQNVQPRGRATVPTPSNDQAARPPGCVRRCRRCFTW